MEAGRGIGMMLIFGFWIGADVILGIGRLVVVSSRKRASMTYATVTPDCPRRVDPEAQRVRHPRAPRPDHQAGSRSIRWAAIESVQTLSKTSVVGRTREHVADRRGHNVGVVAAARQQLEYVFYALRDHHVRALEHHRLRRDPRRAQPGRRGSCRS